MTSGGMVQAETRGKVCPFPTLAAPLGESRGSADGGSPHFSLHERRIRTSGARFRQKPEGKVCPFPIPEPLFPEIPGRR